MKKRVDLPRLLMHPQVTEHVPLHFIKPSLVIIYDLETNHDCLCLDKFSVDPSDRECPLTSVILAKVSPRSPLWDQNNCTDSHKYIRIHTVCMPIRAHTGMSCGHARRQMHACLHTHTLVRFQADLYRGKRPCGGWLRL